MILGRKRPFNNTTFVGLVLMALANIVRWVLERHSSLPEDPRDALVGLFYGLAIGCLLLGVWRMNRTGATPPDRC